MLRVDLVLATLVLSWSSLASCEVKYAVTGSKMMRPGTPYILSVTTSSVARSGSYYLDVFITRRQDKENLVKKIFKMKSGTTTMLTLDIPENVPEGSYTFYINAYNGLAFNQSQSLIISRKVHSLVIQTDKRLYKPGQTCLFRVIAFNPNLRPYEHEVNITIYDTSLNKIKKLVNQKSEYGVTKGELELSNLTPLGQWKIVAESKYAKEEQFFEVAEYVLPKFEVSVHAPEFFFINENFPSKQQDIPISILAKYTYGKPVKGVVTLGIKLAGYWYSKEQPVLTKTMLLEDGKADTMVAVRDLDRLLPSTWTYRSVSYRQFFVEANVTETITGTILSGNTTLKTRPHRLQLNFLPGSQNNYKPGLPYKAYVSLQKLDGSLADLTDLQDTQGNFRSLSVELTSTYPYIPRPPNTPGPPAPPAPPAPRGPPGPPGGRPLPRPPSTKKNLTVELDKNGLAYFEFETNSRTESINIKVSYDDKLANSTLTAYKYINQFKTRDRGGIQLTLRDSLSFIEPRTAMYFNVRTIDSVKTIFFQVVAKGMIVLSRTITFKNMATSHTFGMLFTDSIALHISPQVRFVVSYITKKDEIIADSIALNVKDYFVNKMAVSFSKNVTEPGDESVFLSVETTADSYVGLLAVDQSVLLLHAGNDISQQVVSDELSEYNSNGGRPIPMPRCFDCRWGWPIFPGGAETSSLLNNAGLFVLTNFHIKKPEYYRGPFFGPDGPIERDGAPGLPGPPAPAPPPPPPTPENDKPTTASSPKVRKNFPETFIWTDVISNENGSVKLKVKVPDTITSWVLSGFSVNKQLGLGISDSPAKLTVVKPFFISLNLPYSVIRGEEFGLQVTVSNYYGQNLEAEVTLLASEYFQVINCVTRQPENVRVVKTVEVKNNDAMAVYFWVVAKTLGQIPIEVSANAGVGADAVRRKLLVKPEGQTQYYSTSSMIQLSEGETYNKEFIVEFPPTGVVPGSIQLEMTLIGDVIGTSLNGIEDLLKMPYGCGEQNLLSFAPDVFIVAYLQVSGQLTIAIQQKALKFINAGYQRQLTYQRSDGSFSAFGESDKSGSTWLSAFTVKIFAEAKEFIPVQDSKVAKTVEWIMRNQASDGTFHEPPGGRVIHAAMQGGSASGISMTAYVLISLLENKNNSDVDATRYENSVEKATAYLESKYKDYSTNAYVLSIISYAFFKAESPQLNAVLSFLQSLAINEDGMQYWKGKQEEPSNGWKSRYGKPKSYNVELASYVLLVYSKQGDLTRALPIAKWLLTQRNSRGGFASTQDTVLALEALSAFAALVAPQTEDNGILVELTNSSGTVIHTFDQVARANALFLQSFALPAGTTSIAARATGQGVALIQLIVNYNVETVDRSQNLQLDVTTRKVEENLVLDLTTSWSKNTSTGMVVVEINFLTGYDYMDEGTLEREIGGSFKKLEITPAKLVIYLDELNERELSFSVKMREVLSVSNVKPALVKAYLYYDPSTVVSSFYSSQSGQTWEGACPLCCP